MFKNLFREMKNHWENKNDSYKKQVKYKKIENDLLERMTELHNLEIEWQKHKIEHEKNKENLHKKELEIESKIIELKKIFKKNLVEIDVKPEFYFNLQNGMILKNIVELRECLLDLPEDVFKYHVNQNKNDFYVWIKDVFNLNDLAEEILKVDNKKELHKILKSY
jgi:hypothetical protein